MQTTQTTADRALAGAVAVLGDGAPVGAAAQLAGLEPDDGERAADALAAGGVFAPSRPLRFAHPALRAATTCRCRPASGRSHTAAPCALLAELSADVAAVSAHACAVEPGGDAHVADALIAGGRSALCSGAPRQAALLLARAIAEPPRAEARPAARALLARALTLLGDRRAPCLTADVLAEAAPHAREGLAAQLVDALWHTGAVDAALVLARRTADAEPPGIAAARAAQDGALPAGEIVRAASIGVRGATASRARLRDRSADRVRRARGGAGCARRVRERGGRPRGGASSWRSCGA